MFYSQELIPFCLEIYNSTVMKITMALTLMCHGHIRFGRGTRARYPPLRILEYQNKAQATA